MKIARTTLLLVAALAACSAVASAQNAKLRIDALDRLEDKATKVVDVSLDEKLIGMVSRLIKKTNATSDEARKAADLISGIKEIYVRSYEFETEGAYSTADVESIRSQVKGGGWERLVGVRSKKEGENAEVYVLMPADKVLGLAVIAANPKELTVVNIVGSFDLERLSELDGELGVPRLELKRDAKPSGQ
jgi:hypothetical protein